jgi:hypothetical protein
MLSDKNKHRSRAVLESADHDSEARISKRKGDPINVNVSMLTHF